MDARLAALEAHMTHVTDDVREIKSDLKDIRNDMKVDFRILIAAGITATCGLAWLLATGFKWI